MAAHTYWRLYMTATSSNDAAQMIELQMYDASGTSLTTGGTASASASFGGNPPSLAFDANLGTLWSSGLVGTPWWLKYQFASPVDVASMRIVHANQYIPVTFKLQFSDDDSAWTDTITATGFSWAGIKAAASFVLNPVSGFYSAWRIKFNANGGNTAAGLDEIEFRETAGGADATTTTQNYPTAIGQFSTGLPAWGAFDNAAAVWAYQTGAIAGMWIGYVFPTAKKIVQVSIKASTGNAAPVNFDIEGSNDGGITWTTVQNFVTPSTWANGETRVFDITATATGGLLLHPGMEGWRPLLTGGIHG
jgi:hypothetical protein